MRTLLLLETGLLVSFFCLVLIRRGRPIKWLALNQAEKLWTQTGHCPKTKEERKKYGLLGYQTKLCRRFPMLMAAIMRSARATKLGCQYVFRHRRWNCSSVDLAPYLTPDLSKGTREQSFVYAFSSAIVLHQIATACGRSELPLCQCGTMPAKSSEQDFKWSGCSDNHHYGELVSTEWADAGWMKRGKRRRGRRRNKQLRRRRLLAAAASAMQADGPYINMADFMKDANGLTPRAKMNMHNSRAGRAIAVQMLTKKCKCHGVSGSCSVKTCWLELPSILEIAQMLRSKYERATEVLMPRRSMKKAKDFKRADRVGVFGRLGSVGAGELVYVRKSPDYCTRDARLGSLGTTGRHCNATSRGHDGCASMCCGRGYDTRQETISEKCHCRYIHCCYVDCKQCRYTVDKHHCK